MKTMLRNEYQPEYSSPPGETLLETLENLGMSQAELALRTGRPRKTINEIIQGKAAITPETALQLERVLGIPASFWNRREQQYRELLARQEDRQRAQQWIGWLRELPVKAMIQKGWIQEHTDQAEQTLEVLKFFGVASPETWRATWKQEMARFHTSSSPQPNVGVLVVWLRQGERTAAQIDCAPFDARRFRQKLEQLGSLMGKPPDVAAPELVRLCASAGVAVTFAPELPNIGRCGAARWLHPDKALIQLSSGYEDTSQLWLAFFHEAGHLLLHQKRQAFLDCSQEPGPQPQEADLEEQEADAFARRQMEALLIR